MQPHLHHESHQSTQLRGDNRTLQNLSEAEVYYEVVERCEPDILPGTMLINCGCSAAEALNLLTSAVSAVRCCLSAADNPRSVSLLASPFVQQCL